MHCVTPSARSVVVELEGLKLQNLALGDLTSAQTSPSGVVSLAAFLWAFNFNRCVFVCVCVVCELAASRGAACAAAFHIPPHGWPVPAARVCP